MQLADRKEIVYEVSTNFALASMDDEAHPDLYVFLEDDEAVSLFWEILKQDGDHYEEYSKKISARSVGSCTVVKALNELSKNGKLPYPILAHWCFLSLFATLYAKGAETHEDNHHPAPGTSA